MSKSFVEEKLVTMAFRKLDADPGRGKDRTLTPLRNGPPTLRRSAGRMISKVALTWRNGSCLQAAAGKSADRRFFLECPLCPNSQARVIEARDRSNTHPTDPM